MITNDPITLVILGFFTVLLIVCLSLLARKHHFQRKLDEMSDTTNFTTTKHSKDGEERLYPMVLHVHQRNHSELSLRIRLNVGRTIEDFEALTNVLATHFEAAVVEVERTKRRRVVTLHVYREDPLTDSYSLDEE